MLNQSFSAENFRRIFDFQNRKGVYLEADFFPDVAAITSKLKQCKHDFKKLKKSKPQLTTEEYQEKKEVLNEKNNTLKEKKEIALTIHMENVSNLVNSSGFHFPIKTIVTRNEKVAYYFDHEPCSYFASKQVQYNIKKLYKVKQANRNEIISQLIKILGDTFPKIVIRTDIKGFYENIPQNILLGKLNKDPLLTLSSKKIITKILQEYRGLSGSDRGIPRGIGISAYLSELYLKSLDEKIKAHHDILYYARYVDDIVAIFIPDPAYADSDYLDFIKSEVNSLQLELNDSGKTISIDLKKPKHVNMDYLGYKLSFGLADTVVEMSNSKFNRYKKRIDLTFDDYVKGSKCNEKISRKLFVKRLRFLTGNTRLLNNKRNALVGIHFTNNLITDTSKLVGLDRYLKHKISALSSTTLKNRVSSYSFEKGFLFKRFFNYTEKDLMQIVSVWKHD